jgi:hypothetical protein
MASRDEIRIATQMRLKWVVTGNGPALRPEADMRAISEWIDRAVDAWLLDPESFEGSMLQAMFDGAFTIASIANGEPRFALTDYGRALGDSMPHDLRRLGVDEGDE